MHLLARTSALTAFLLLTLGSTGCPECKGIVCDACDVPLHVVLTDADTGLSVPGAEVVGESGSCQERSDGSATDCRLQRSGEPWGVYSFDIAAPGYVSRHFEETVAATEGGGCCDCGYVMVRAESTLSPQ